jgi:hypothetical protein
MGKEQANLPVRLKLEDDVESNSNLEKAPSVECCSKRKQKRV